MQVMTRRRMAPNRANTNISQYVPADPSTSRRARNASIAAVPQMGAPRNLELNDKPKRRTGMILLLVALVMALVLVGGAAGAYIYMQSISNKITAGVTEETREALATEEVVAGEPFYMLIIGTDGNEERETYEDTFRSDSMILARVDPQQKKVTLISIERDTYVYLNYTNDYGQQVTEAAKINASASYGGAPLVISTISEFAGVPISHYIQVDMEGFAAAVDALGGITVDVPIDINDPEAGGSLSAGEQTLTGEQALILCRSRHAYDQYGSGDYYRMANQRMVLGAIAHALLSSDVTTMASTISAMSSYIITDMNVEDLVSLATAFQGMDTSTDIYSARNPTYSVYKDDIWYEYADIPSWQEMMTRVDAGLAPYADEAMASNNGGLVEENYV